MKNLSLFILLFLTAKFLTAQEFIPPDTSALRKTHVKNVKIYYTGTGTKHYLSHEFRYDKKSRCIYSSEGTNSYYYSFTYNDKSQVMGSYQRSNSGKLIQGYLNDYYPNGKLFHTSLISERDSIHPNLIYTYDTLGNKIGDDYFTNGKLNRSYKSEFDLNKQIIHRIDSTPGKEVFEYSNSKTIRQTYYDANNIILENWLIYYDGNNRLEKTICYHGNEKEIYSIAYKADDDFAVMKNGKSLDQKENIDWDRKFHYLLPPPPQVDYPHPYSDPVPKMDYKHELVHDKKGNITKDIITGAYPYMNFEKVEFDYEYEYW